MSKSDDNENRVGDTSPHTKPPSYAPDIDTSHTPSAVSEARKKIKSLTRRLLGYSEQTPPAPSSFSSGSKGTCTTTVDLPSPKSANKNDSLHGPESGDRHRPPSPSSTQWDELCLGLWVQDTHARSQDGPGYCYGLSLVRTNSVNSIQKWCKLLLAQCRH